MNILVTNDDGIQAQGLSTLVEYLSEIADVYVCAPDAQRSACGHGITMNTPITVNEREVKGAKAAWSISGTPADCVKLGVKRLAPNVDMVFSGINHGANLGTDAFYSGTVAGAAEGVFCGFPSVAVSICSHNPKCFDPAGQMARTVAEKVTEHGLEKGVMLNVNIPDRMPEEILGVRVTAQGVMQYDELFEIAVSPFGQKYYWYGGNLIKKKQDPDVDVEAIRAQYISISPLQFNLTAKERIPELKEWKMEYHK